MECVKIELLRNMICDDSFSVDAMLAYGWLREANRDKKPEDKLPKLEDYCRIWLNPTDLYRGILQEVENTVRRDHIRAGLLELVERKIILVDNVKCVKPQFAYLKLFIEKKPKDWVAIDYDVVLKILKEPVYSRFALLETYIILYELLESNDRSFLELGFASAPYDLKDITLFNAKILDDLGVLCTRIVEIQTNEGLTQTRRWFCKKENETLLDDYLKEFAKYHEDVIDIEIKHGLGETSNRHSKMRHPLTAKGLRKLEAYLKYPDKIPSYEDAKETYELLLQWNNINREAAMKEREVVYKHRSLDYFKEYGFYDKEAAEASVRPISMEDITEYEKTHKKKQKFTKFSNKKRIRCRVF